MSNYDDIINLPHHVSKKHKPMTLYNRAAQFSSFAALVGYEDLIDETGRLTDSKIDLNDDRVSEINDKLIYLSSNKDIEAEYTYFVEDQKKKGGSYKTSKGTITKVDLYTNTIILDNKKKININSLIDINLP